MVAVPAVPAIRELEGGDPDRTGKEPWLSRPHGTRDLEFEFLRSEHLAVVPGYNEQHAQAASIVMTQ
jgi:hypothetical protein